MWESRQDIEKENIDFFQNLYTGEDRVRTKLCEIPCKQLSPPSAGMIEEDFSLATIQEAVFGLGRDRAPSPNGFSIVLFQ